MSKTESLHHQLCVAGAEWLRKQKRNYQTCPKKPCWGPCQKSGCCNRFKYVAVELCTWSGELTDVWALGNYNDSTIIEVKTSHSDFLADKKKWCRSKEFEEKGYCAGSYRWYLCPKSIISKDELPDGWGLLYWDGNKVYPVVSPSRKFDNTSWADLGNLTSILRREEFPERIYNYRNK